MATLKLFVCNGCGTEGKGGALPDGWIAGVRYPVFISKFDGMTWAVTLCICPPDVQDAIYRENRMHQAVPINESYQYEELQFCSSDCVSRYLGKLTQDNRGIFASAVKPFVKQIAEAVCDGMDEHDKRKAVTAPKLEEKTT
jgi:hypothetical protein